MERYIIYSSTGDPGILSTVKAESPDDALYQHAKHYGIKDVAFLDYLYGAGGLYDFFMKDEHGLFHPGSRMVLRSDLTPEIAEAKFQANVREFFKDNPEHADLYLKFIEYWSALEGESYDMMEWDEYLKQEHARWQFPEPMLIKIFLADCTRWLVVAPLKKYELNEVIEIG